MKNVMDDKKESAYCQVCIFEYDCSPESKHDALKERDKYGYYGLPSCFQTDRMMEEAVCE